MSRQSHSAEISRSLFAASRRLDLLALLEGSALGAVAAIVILLIGWIVAYPSGLLIAAALLSVAAGGVARLVFSRRERSRLSHIAMVVEGRAGNCRNVVVSAAELIEAGTSSHRPYIADRIFRDAAQAIAGVHLKELFPSRNAVLSLSGALALLLILSAMTVQRAGGPPDLSTTVAGGASISQLTLAVIPPAYTSTGAAPDTVVLRNPSHVEVLSGSRIRIRASGMAASIDLETLVGLSTLRQSGGGVFEGEMIAEADGFIALQPRGSDSTAGNRKLVGVTVIPDRAPQVRITAPGRDMRLENAQRTLNIEMEASDDIALSSLRLRYTRVAGSGEQFTFTEGEIAVQTTKTSETSWQSKASWDLSTLQLGAGDMVVYRAEVRDGRPGAPAYESDSYIIELAGPGALLSGGFSIDEELDRYAISQQMVILKSERLLARRNSMPGAAYAQESLNLAAEQRKVRAEFIFMMGGELAEEVTGDMAGLRDLNEESHAALDDEAIAGRLAHEGRLDLIRAIRSMSFASTSLNAASVDTALTHERAALASLQRAFARTRYILRTLTERERIDMTRRLTGVLATALRERGPVRMADPDSVSEELREILARLAAVAGSDTLTRNDVQEATQISQRILRLSSASSEMQQISMQVDSGAAFLLDARAAPAQRHFENAVVGLTDVLRNRLAPTPPVAASRSVAGKRLDGILADALRGRRSGSERRR